MTSSAQSLYDKALRSYLLTKYAQAANTCNKAIAALNDEKDETLTMNIWTLYINIASTLLVNNGKKQAFPVKLLGIEENARSLQDVCRCIWNKVSQANGSFVDSRLVSACLILDCKLSQYNVGREIAEEWFASIPDSVLDNLSNSKNEEGGYYEVVQLYIVRILPGMNDFDSSRTFLQYNEILSDLKKKEINHLIQEQQNELEKETIAKTKLEEATKLAAEKKKAEEEAKRLEKDRQDELDRIQLLENQKQQEIAAATEIKQIESNRREAENIVPVPPAASPVKQRTAATTTNNNVTALKRWMSQMTAKGAGSYATILIFVFALLALLRGQRGRLSIALQTLLNKLWQTIKMGTKVTYM